jgi:hypothetical protein
MYHTGVKGAMLTKRGKLSTGRHVPGFDSPHLHLLNENHGNEIVRTQRKTAWIRSATTGSTPAFPPETSEVRSPYRQP